MAKSEMIKTFELYFALPWGESDFEQAHWEACWKAARAAGMVERDRLQARVEQLQTRVEALTKQRDKLARDNQGLLEDFEGAL